MARPPKTGVLLRQDSRLQFEWIALGFYCCVFLDRVVALDHDAGKSLEVMALGNSERFDGVPIGV